MYWYNELTIAMNNKTAATAAMAVAKNVLTTTSIEEYCEGEFAGFADSLLVKKNEVLCDGDGAVHVVNLHSKFLLCDCSSAV